MLGNKREDTLLLLKSMAVNYPILNEHGFGFNKLLLLIVPEGETKMMVDFLSDEGTPVLSEKMPWKQIASVLENANSTWVVYPYTHSRKGVDFLASLATAVKVGEITGHRLNALPLTISEGIPQGCIMEEFFTVYLDEGIGFPDAEMAIPPDDQIPVVLDKIKECTDGNCPTEKKALLAAACFVYPNLVKKGLKKQFPRFLRCAEQLIEEDDNNRSADDIGSLFIKNLYAWQGKNRFCRIYGIPYLYIDIREGIGQIMFFDDEFVYMKEILFKQILGNLVGIFSIDIIKKSLREEHILFPEYTKTYTVKMGYYDLDGNYHRERMLRFYRKRLSTLGELEFVDLCLEAQGGSENVD